MLKLRAPNLKTHRLFSTIQPPQKQESIHTTLSQLSQEISNTIRKKTRFEQLLTSQYPHSLLHNPTLINLILTSPSISKNPLLSLRFLLFISNSLTTHTTHSPNIPTQPNPPNSLLRSWNNALSWCLHSKRIDLVSNLYQCMSLLGVVGDETTAGYLIQALCEEEKFFDAYRTLKAFSRSGLFPDVCTCSKLVGGFAKVGNYGKVSELLHMMIGEKRMPDVFTYQMIIHALCDNWMGDEGFRIFKELKLRGYRVDVVTYSTMIDGLCKMRQMNDAKKLWVEMVEKGMKPCHYTYGSVIDGCFKYGDVENAKKIYEEMIEKGYGENTVSCNIMINGLCLLRYVDEAIVTFDEMGRKGIKKDVITYNTLIQGLCKEDRIIEAKIFYSKILKVGLGPTIATYTPLIIGLCNQGKMTQAINLVKHMRDSGIEPLVWTNDYIITAFCKTGKVEDGLAWLASMLKKKLKPRPETFNKLVEYLSLVGRIDDVMPVLNVMFEIGCELGSSVCCLLVEKLCGDNGKLQANGLLVEILLNEK